MRKLVLDNGFLEQANDLPKEIKAKIFKCLQYLVKDTEHPSLQTKKIQGSNNGAYECRIDRNIRMIYMRDGEFLVCKYIGAHDSTIKMGAHMAISVDDIVLTKHLQNDAVKNNEIDNKNCYTIEEVRAFFMP
jgi:mRNA-degrading endonuclease YafQ of YafQ-DinJ toxin-antitoxin module